MLSSSGSLLGKFWPLLAGGLGRLAKQRQFACGDGPRRSTKPAIRLPCVGVNAIDDDLLAVAENFDFLAGLPARRDELAGDLLEWLVGAEWDRALGRQTEARHDVAMLFEPGAG